MAPPVVLRAALPHVNAGNDPRGDNTAEFLHFLDRPDSLLSRQWPLSLQFSGFVTTPLTLSGSTKSAGVAPRGYSGSGIFLTVGQFASARLMFVATFLRHSSDQYLV
jgi:hypothetical protein